MSFRIDRRSLLLGSAAVLASAAAPPWRRAAAASPVKLTLGRRTLEVKGRAAPAFGIMQADGTSGLTLDPGARFQVDLVSLTDPPAGTSAATAAGAAAQRSVPAADQRVLRRVEAGL